MFGFLAAYILCAALLPGIICKFLLALFVLSLLILAYYLVKLEKAAAALKEAKKLCNNANFTILIAWSDVKENCPKECVPDLVTLDCEC